MKISNAEIPKLAKAITDALMLGGWGKVAAARLQLRGPHEEDLGGLCRLSVQFQIEEILKTFPKSK